MMGKGDMDTLMQEVDSKFDPMACIHLYWEQVQDALSKISQMETFF